MNCPNSVEIILAGIDQRTINNYRVSALKTLRANHCVGRFENVEGTSFGRDGDCTD